MSWVPVAHNHNPSYLEGWDLEDHSSKLAQANSSRDPHLQNNLSKNGEVVQAQSLESHNEISLRNAELLRVKMI
jgi:hypothetical protein